MTDDADVRRKRAGYRAAHRGTKEMDALIGRYAQAKLPNLDGEGLAGFELFLAVADPTLQAWIFGKESCRGSAFERLVDDIRAFHALDRITDVTE